MSYCLNPNCSKPQNPTGTTFCLTCGAKILLKNRYRATDFLAAGGMGKNLLAVDEDTPLKKRCVIKQFSPDSSIVNNPTAFQKAIELFNREAVMLDNLGDESRQIPRYRVYFGQIGMTIVLLLCGGDKSTQEQDIRQAIKYWRDYERRENSHK